MPINIQNAILFTFVFVIVVSLMSITIYTLVTNMLTDAYRYEKALEKANEKVRLAGIISDAKLYYGVRNIGLSKIRIKEIGVVDVSGNNHILAKDITLDPGKIYIKTTGSIYGTLYIITERGNIFSAPIIDVDKLLGEKEIRLRSLLPSVSYIESPLAYSEIAKYFLSLTTYGYVFGYVFVDDPKSNNYVFLVFGPYNVADLFKKKNVPLHESKSETSGSIYAEAEFYFEISNDNVAWYLPYYKIVMPITIKRTDNEKGLLVRGCIGFIWRTISNNMYGISVKYQDMNIPSVCYSSAHPNIRICDELHATVVASVKDIKSLIPELARSTTIWRSVNAPVGAQTYLLYTKCFYIESEEVTNIETTYKNPYTYVHGQRINTYIAFPGTTYVGKTSAYNDSFKVLLKVNPVVVLLSILENI